MQNVPITKVMMKENISSTATVKPMIDKLLLASKLKDYHEEANSSGTSNNLGFGLRVLEQISQHMPTMAIKGLKDIAIPISPPDSQILKSKSKVLNEGIWEMALTSNSLDMANPSFGQYLSKSIPMMTDLALRHLKVPRKNVQGLEVQPKKLIIMEPGQTLLISTRSNQRGVFATMIAQIPVQGGHEDGLLKVFRGNQSRIFKNSLESDRLFHYTVFLSDCSCQMQKLSSGSRVTLIFDLVCSNPLTLFPPMPAMLGVTQMLEQLKANSADRLLAIPLDKDESSFSSLSSRSNHLVDLFMSLKFLDIHLAVVCHYRVGKANQRTGCECCSKRGCPCQEVKLQEISQEQIVTTKWLGTSSKEVKFDQLHIDTKTEIVGDGPVFFETPTQEKIDVQTLVLEQWFFRPLLVVWHKERSVEIDCLHRFGTLLDHLNRQANSPNEKEELHLKLIKVVAFCCEHPEILEKEENSSHRLLKLCLEANAKKEVLRLLEVIAVHEGLKNDDMVKTLCQVIKDFGWKECSTLISKFFSVNYAEDQMLEYTSLVLSLLDGACNQGALKLGNQIFNMLCTTDLIKTLEISVLGLCVDMLIRLDQEPQTSDPRRLEILAHQIKEKLPTFMFHLHLLSCVQYRLDARPPDVIPDSAINWYYDLCLHLASLPIPPEMPSDKVFSAVKLFVSSGDDTLLEAFIQQLTNTQNQKNNVLKSLLKLEDLWKSAEISTENKQVVYSLVDRRIQWLIAIPKPKSTWAHPNAVVVGHPRVEQFMRSDEEGMVYANFNNIQHARNWARKHFTGCEIAGADPFGMGKNAYCVITKRRKFYEGDNMNYAACQKELMGLIDLRLQRLGDAPCTVVVNAKTEEIFSVVVQPNIIAPGQPIKLPVSNTAVDVKPTVTSSSNIVNNGILSAVHSNVKTPRSARQYRSKRKCPTAPPSSSFALIQQQVSNVTVIKNTVVNTRPTPGPSQEPTKVTAKTPSVAVLVESIGATQNVTPKRVGVAKRPLTSFSPVSHIAPIQTKSQVATIPVQATTSQQRQPLTQVQRVLIEPAVRSLKRLKLETAFKP